ncbi:MAG: hypothetical protein WC693_02315 [Patescibacteria group bacterium]|jgi:hypothetical protein
MRASLDMPGIKAERDHDFHEAISMGNLAEAEEWLEEEKGIILHDEPEWVEELEEMLFDAYTEQGDSEGAKRVAEHSMNADSKIRRMNALVEHGLTSPRSD